MKTSGFQLILLVVFGSLLTAGVMIFALVASQGNTSSVGTVTIWGTLDQDIVDASLQKAVINNPSFEKVYYQQFASKDFYSKLIDAMASDTGPDIVIVRSDYAYSLLNKFVVSPYSSISTSTYQTAFVDASSSFLADSGVEALPFATDPLILYLNRDIFASAKYAVAPSTWIELTQMIPKLTVKDDTGSITRGGIAMGEYSNISNAKDIISMLLMQSGNQITGRDATGRPIAQLASTDMGSTTEPTLEFFTGFSDPGNIQQYTWSKRFAEAREAFANGDVAMYIGYASDYPTLRSMNPNLAFEIAAIPQADTRSAMKVANVAHVYGLAVARTSKNKTGAFTIAALIAQSEFAVPLARSLSMSPALRSVIDAGNKKSAASSTKSSSQSMSFSIDSDRIDNADERHIFDSQALIAKAWLDPNPSVTDNLFRIMIEGVTSGGSRASEAAQVASQGINEIFSK